MAVDMCKIQELTKQHMREMNESKLDVNKVEKICIYCGLTHVKGQCKAYGTICHNCGKKNHFARVCKSKKTEVRTKPRHYDNSSTNKVHGVDTTPNSDDENYVSLIKKIDQNEDRVMKVSLVDKFGRTLM